MKITVSLLLVNCILLLIFRCTFVYLFLDLYVLDLWVFLFNLTRYLITFLYSLLWSIFICFKINKLNNNYKY
ncbi:hypothetical protein GLOIN_2v1507444 [Rhizophagus irregularis DAOM 181602=DAOM 197198]|uniref:Uncharacterized protein n=1 Tax=Rhizophagus irregularis (strain DAOM 181602 / DAOM 197198 / MUCL 43194) TaxID=747089 RepID=A0A2P4QUS7_RHIID|nr:hypothetical protein GLOIN_2v1507444 [Rhizophagus irregularis DAOM 181602=DAOM 197198]POG81387.1 hypothetical protein GLOIN_2v1507444 [Rhizophagus irregularis DAOM 181602=DAOM 197198]GET60523.1 hypothetical protein GLOIN_2v1507444 [Rhizophagus irregularis DAOM 181602=DAOM 197198]|eukprot:XP_025188253.1 hypothetical protein GLOIN_2v1507444 [Rhizophagus irregularis DAOM 181602=DAOM 197198]